ncbi:hypothetical protein GQ600_18166 [Phytophthora cactorum]|nr:hypothetical protein GQ600_18166 [Phytophthora cactorum]
MRLIFVLAFSPSPLSSNSKGKCPSTYNCSATKVSTAIQAAECSHNTRTSKTQTFAVFVTDHQYDGNNGYPGVGTGCIKDPTTGDCGCESSDGTFVADSSSCV